MTRNIVVIKFGGSILNHVENRKRFFRNIKQVLRFGYTPVIIHGGGKDISEWCARVGIVPKFIKGLRYTDKPTMEIVEMVLSGKLNKQLAGELSRMKVHSIGLSCRDGELVRARKRNELGLIGSVRKVNTQLFEHLFAGGLIPVVSSVCSDGKGGALNVNADEVAYAIAVALKAKRLIFMTDTAGVLHDVKDEKSLIKEIRVSEIHGLLKRGIITGGMMPKLLSIAQAIKRGIEEVDIVDGRIKGILLTCMRTTKICGTRIRR